MSKNLNNYTATLTTLGPVFIGSGQILRKNEYVYRGDKVHLIDETKLVQTLQSKGLLDDFIKHIAMTVVHDRSENDLGKYLERHRIDVSQIERYNLFVNTIKNADRMNDLHTHLKDAHGQVYLPGSSLKGMLHTAIIADLESEKRYNFKKPLPLSVSDSDTLETHQLAVYRKVDFSKDFSYLPIYRECIKPKQTIQFNLSGELSIAKLEASIRQTYQAYQTKWAEPILDMYGDDLAKHNFFELYDKPDTDQNIVYLGGGAGFVSKTLHYKSKDIKTARADVLNILKQKFTMRTSPYSFRNPKAIKNPITAPIALKLAMTMNGFVEMGKCRITFQERTWSL